MWCVELWRGHGVEGEGGGGGGGRGGKVAGPSSSLRCDGHNKHWPAPAAPAGGGPVCGCVCGGRAGVRQCFACLH